tara:strand:+ start:1489 stop:2094 length:606 start_codon:yes stop_codon:yes gene_type:complete
MALIDIYRTDCTISDGIMATAKTSQGGIQRIYLFPFVEYGVDDITIADEIITNIPYVTIYEFDVWGASYTESTDVKQGNISYNQSLSFNIKRTESSRELFKLLKRDHCAIFVDRQGNTRIMGLWNGCEAKYSNKTGANKSDMNGYEISLSGSENNQAYWVDDLATLFNIHAPVIDESVENYVFGNTSNYVFEDDDNYIFNN